MCSCKGQCAGSDLPYSLSPIPRITPTLTPLTEVDFHFQPDQPAFGNRSDGIRDRPTAKWQSVCAPREC